MFPQSGRTPSHWSGYTPWRPPVYHVMMWAMDNRTWLVEAEVAACVLAGAIIAFTLMVGHTLWKTMAGKIE